MNKGKKVLVVVGPTASGKSKLALELAKEFQGFLISADSRQVYKGMDIASNKDCGEWHRVGLKKKLFVDGIREEMIDIVSPKQTYSLDNWLTTVKKIIDLDKELPVVVGGTGLYTTALTKGFDLSGNFDAKLRKKIDEELENEGLPALVKKLLTIDPEIDNKIDINNPRRVARALELCYLTGKTINTERQKAPYDFLTLGITQPREVLYKKIDQRVDQMVKQGLLEEVKALLKKGYDSTLPAMTGIGYRQMLGYLNGEMTLEEVIELIKRDSRRYAKRQLSWYRREPNIHWVNNVNEAKKIVKKWLQK